MLSIADETRDMEDELFLLRFENCLLEKAQFNHESHLRVAWLYLAKLDFQHALICTCQGIYNFAKSLDIEHVYHETLTHAWVHLVFHAMSNNDKTFALFLAKNNYLLDKSLPMQSYSESLLNSDLARKQWQEPDLQPLYTYHLQANR